MLPFEIGCRLWQIVTVRGQVPFVANGDRSWSDAVRDELCMPGGLGIINVRFHVRVSF